MESSILFQFLRWDSPVTCASPIVFPLVNEMVSTFVFFSEFELIKLPGGGRG